MDVTPGTAARAPGPGLEPGSGLGDDDDDDDDPNLGPSEPDACYFELIDPATGVTYVVGVLDCGVS